jgi:hypothetical protein
VVRPCEHGNEFSGSIEDREFLELSNYLLLEKELAPWG